MKGSTIVFVLAISAADIGVAQVPDTNASRNLELRLQTSDLREGLPHSFVFSIVNISKHDVRVPTPMAGCSNGTFGAVWLRFRLDPEPGGIPCGCSGGFADIPPVLTQAKRWWKVLRPGEALTVNVPQERLCYDEKSAKSIEFWGHYDPPTISADDQKSLTEAGIDFPHTQMESAHTKFVKKP